MATTRGLVQMVKMDVGGATYVYIGPSPTNLSPFFITRTASDTAEQASVKDDIVTAVAVAMAARREIIAVHADTSSEITGLLIDPV